MPYLINMKKILLTLGLFLISINSSVLHAGSVIGSRHDLSTAGTPRVCEFCHTPHSSNTNTAIAGAPLWNRAETTQTFTLYSSPTMTASTAQPQLASKLCLSCHDGVNASVSVHGNAVSTKHDLVKPPNHPAPDMSSEPNCERCHSDFYSGKRRTLVLGTDLSNDHPISVAYQTSNPTLHTPTDAQKGWGGASQNEVKLYAGFVECGSCHNVHNPDVAPFLRKTNVASALCLTCHKK